MRPSFSRSLPTALAVLLACAFAAQAAAQSAAQVQVPPGAVAATPASSAAPPARQRPAPVKVAQAKTESKPTWSELTPAQQAALKPLAGPWSTLGEAHKRKWIALSQNFPTLPPAEQARMHSRMTEWALLSPQQRTQARLNFAETKKVPSDDKKAAWEEYQALPPEEKRKLAAQASKPPAPATAAAVQPVPQQKLANVPKPKKNDPRTPRIASVPSQVDQNTLLPPPGAFPGNP
jgi:hypothetical protein